MFQEIGPWADCKRRTWIFGLKVGEDSAVGALAVQDDLVRDRMLDDDRHPLPVRVERQHVQRAQRHLTLTCK